MTLTDTTISDNSTTGAGGGIYAAGDPNFDFDATVVLNGKSKVTGNSAATAGGVFLRAEDAAFETYATAATLTLNDSSRISNNSATGGIPDSGYGGGVYLINELASVTLKNSSAITGNTAILGGGGIAVSSSGSVNGGTASNVYRNTPDNILTNAPAFYG